MAKRKTTRKRTVKRKTTRKRSSSKRSKKPVKRTVKRESGPAYMVQLSDPKSIRKDILESLREVIIFMQAHEKFMRIQEEKITLFTQLKNDVKDLNQLIEHKLKKHLPKGKLKAFSRYAEKRQRQKEMEKVEVVSARDMARSPETPVHVVSTMPKGPVPQPLPNPMTPAAPLPPNAPPQPTPAPAPVPMAPPMPKPAAPKSDLDDLENQLKDIEDQLRGIQ